jgi:hypothetical protein
MTNKFVNCILRGMRAVQVIDRPRDSALLAAPVRQRILEALREPASASGAARRLGLTRQVATYHFRQLEDAGFLTLGVSGAAAGTLLPAKRELHRPNGVVGIRRAPPEGPLLERLRRLARRWPTGRPAEGCGAAGAPRPSPPAWTSASARPRSAPLSPKI